MGKVRPLLGSDAGPGCMDDWGTGSTEWLLAGVAVNIEYGEGELDEDGRKALSLIAPNHGRWI